MDRPRPAEHRRPGRPIRNKTYPPYQPYSVAVADGTRPIVLYLRLSKYHADGADAIDRQRLDLTRQLHSDGGWTVVGEYVDNDSASASAVRSRSGWQALNKSIEDGTVTAVAFWKLDRTNRIASKIIEWLATCRKSGVTLVSHEDPSAELNEASASAKLLVGIKSLFAEIETDTMSDRQKAAKRHAAEAGFNHGGTVPFGWRLGDRVTDSYGRTGTRFDPHPVEHPALRDAVQRVIDGESLNDIGRLWREEYGITTAAGAQISAGNVRRYLTSPRLMGYRMRQVPEHERGVRINLLDFIARDQHGEPVISQEPVCDRITWMRLQSAITGLPHAERGAYGKNEWLLTGLLRCSTCGGKLYGRTRNRPDGTVERRYNCLTGRPWRPGTCNRSVAIRADETERYLLGWTAAHLTSEQVAQQEALLDKATGGSPAAKIAADLDQARLELQHLVSLQGTEQWRGAKVAILAGMVADAHDRVQSLDIALNSLGVGTGLITGDVLLQRWPEMDFNQRKAMLRKVIDYAEVLTGRSRVRDRLIVHAKF